MATGKAFKRTFELLIQAIQPAWSNSTRVMLQGVTWQGVRCKSEVIPDAVKPAWVCMGVCVCVCVSFLTCWATEAPWQKQAPTSWSSLPLNCQQKFLKCVSQHDSMQLTALAHKCVYTNWRWTHKKVCIPSYTTITLPDAKHTGRSERMERSTM